MQVCATLDELQALVLPRIEGLDPTLLRCILKHDDMNPGNLLIDTNGSILGVIDWEFHSIVPAIIAVGPPPWLPPPAEAESPAAAEPTTSTNSPASTEPQDTEDSKNDEAQFQSTWLFCRKESRELIDHFEELAFQRDKSFYNILKQGGFIREALAWLDLQPRFDPGLGSLRAWITWAAEQRVDNHQTIES
ncbi:hypothetical protein HGRIS_011623 [Hohenbuehelia grisea]|uniref:Aminoglycoside phosphotransferase domain-containing protein n=1 Tax=Hohenbuehelia grisea TaxID=104357 RepID=A0ABR3JVM8_9AGAR